jgi:hypothetical protein
MPGMVSYISNPSNQGAEAKDCELEASLGYRVKPYLQKSKKTI